MKKLYLLVIFCVVSLATRAQITITSQTTAESCKGAKDGKAKVFLKFPAGYSKFVYYRLNPLAVPVLDTVTHYTTLTATSDSIEFLNLPGAISSITVFPTGPTMNAEATGVNVGSGYDVQEPQVGVGALNQNITVCEGAQLKLFSQSESGAGYSWIGPNSFISAVQNPVINNAQAINAGTYKVVASHLGNQSKTCYSDTVSITPTVIDVPNPSFTIPVGICQNDPLSLVADAPTSGVDSYDWKMPNGSPAFKNNNQGPFNVNYNSSTGASPNTITLTVTKSGCKDSVKHDLQVRPKPSASLSAIQNKICSGTNAQLTITFVGTAPWDYSYSDGTTTFSGTANTSPLNLSVVVNSNTSYTLTSVSSFACTGTVTGSPVTITVDPSPTATLDPLPATICENGTPITLTGSPTSPGTGVFSGSGVSGSTFNPANAGGAGVKTITYKYTDLNGCFGTDSKTITVQAKPVITVTSVPNQCKNGAPVTLNATPAGGTFSGLGVSGNTFNPATVGLPSSVKIYYTVLGANGCTNKDSSVTIGLITPPNAGITAFKTSICAGQSTTLLIGFNGTKPWNYTYNNGVSNISATTNSTTVSIPISPASTTTYSMVSVSDANCPSGTLSPSSVKVTVNPLPVINFTSPGGPFCETASPVTLVATPAGGTFSTTPAAAITGTQFDPTKAGFAAPSVTRTITYSYTDPSTTCANTATQNVTIMPQPTATFTALPSPVCPNTNVAVTYTGNGSASAVYNWNFDSPSTTTGSGKGPYTLQWNTGGTKNVTLTVTDYSCTTALITNSVVVKPAATATISGTQGICTGNNAPLTFNFTGTGPWNFTYTDGTTNVSTSANVSPFTVNVSPASTKTYSLVSVTDVGACPGTVSGSAVVTVVTKPSSNFTLGSSVCQGTSTPILASVNSPTATYTWNFGGGTPAVVAGAGTHNISWASSGSKQVSLVINESSGCISDTTKKTITVNPLPTATISNDTTVCQGNSGKVKITFTGTAPFTAQLKDQNNTIYNVNSPTNVIYFPVTVATTSTFTVVANSVKDANNCTGTGSGTVVVTLQPLPTATISSNSQICAGGSSSIKIDFTGTPPFDYTYQLSTGGTVSGTTNLSSITLPVSPASTTTYTLVSVNNSVASSGAKCSGTVFGSSVVTVVPIPTAAFSVPASGAACIGDIVTVTYTGTSSALATYAWNFGGGINTNGATGKGPYLIGYGTTGIKTITLTVTDQGCVSPMVSHTVDIKELPSAKISGDQTVCQNANATLNFTFATGTAPFTVTYTDGTSNFTGTVNTNPGTLAVAMATVGTTKFKLVNVKDANNCSSTNVSDSAVVKVISTPSSDFSLNAGVCVNNATTITYNSANSPTATYTWNFGGGTIVSGSGSGPYQVSWPSIGSKTVSLQVTESALCPSPTTQKNILVGLPPTATISNDTTVCSGNSGKVKVTFTGASPYNITLQDQNGVDYPFSNINTTVFYATVNVATTSTFTVKSTSDANCSGTGSGTVIVTVNPVPTATISQNTTVCAGDSTDIKIDFTGVAPYSYTYLLSTGGTVTGTTNMASLTLRLKPAVTTTYALVSMSDKFCTGTVSGSATATVVNMPVVDFNISPTVSCENTPIQVSFTGTATALATYSWDFGVNGAPTSTTGVGPHNVTYAATGTQTIKLDVTDQACPTVSLSKTIDVKPLARATISGDQGVCQGGTAILQFSFPKGTAPFTFVYSNGTSNFTGNSATNSTTVSVVMPSAGVTNFTLVSVTDVNTCVSTDVSGIAKVTVVSKPSSDFTLATKMCQNDTATITYNATSSPTAVYQWDFASGTVLSGTGSGPYKVIWPSNGNKTVSLVVNESAGCISDTTKKTIAVNALPLVNIGIDTITVCRGDAANIKISLVTGQTPYQVTLFDQNGNNFNYPSLPINVAFVPLLLNDTSTIQVLPNSVIDGNGCAGSGIGKVIVNVNPLPTATMSKDGPVCEGQSTTIKIDFTGEAPFKFTYTDGTTNFTDSTNSKSVLVSVSPNVTSTYTLVSVQDKLCTGTTVSGSATVTVIKTPIADFSIPAAACLNLDADITFTGTATNAATYTWNFDTGNITSGSGKGPYKVNWAVAGTYNVGLTVLDQGCPSLPVTKSIIIKDKPSGEVVSNDTTICERQSVNLKLSFIGLPPFSYQYTDGTNTSVVLTTNNATETVTVVPTIVPLTIYKLATLSDLACAANVLTDSMEVNIIPAPTSTFTVKDSSCFGDTLDVVYTGINFGAATFDWHAFDGATVVSGSILGPYKITYPSIGDKFVKLTITENGCTDSTTMPVHISTPPTVTMVADTAICSGSTAPLKLTFVGNAPFTYNITNATGGPFTSNTLTDVVNVSPLSNTTYQLISVLDKNACKATLLTNNVVTVTVNQSPKFDFSGKTEICKNDSAEVYIDYQSGKSPWTAAVNVLSPSATFTKTSVDTKDTVKFILSGDATVSVTVTDSNLCSTTSTKTLDIVLRPIPDAAFLLDPTLCTGDATVVLNLNTPDPSYTYSIDAGDASFVDGSTNDGTFVVIWDIAGLKKVKYTVFDGVCFSNDAVDSILVNPGPTAQIVAPNVICQGDMVDVTINLTGTPNFDFGLDVEGVKQDVLAYSSNSYTFKTALKSTGVITIDYVNDNNALGCANTAGTSKTVTVNPTPNLTISGLNPSYCYTNPLAMILASDPAVVYDFSKLPVGSFADLGGGNAELYPLAAGVGNYPFTAKLSNSFGCADTVNTALNVVDEQDAAYTLDNKNLCQNVDFLLPVFNSVLGFGVYKIDKPGLAYDTVTGAILPKLSTAGTYLLSHTPKDNGCPSGTYTDTVYIRKIPNVPTLMNKKDTIICRQTRVFNEFSVANAEAGVDYVWKFRGGNGFGVIKDSIPSNRTVKITWVAKSQSFDTLTLSAQSKYCASDSSFIIYNDTVSAEVFAVSDSTLDPNFIKLGYTTSASYTQYDSVFIARNPDLLAPWEIASKRKVVGDSSFVEMPTPSTSMTAWYYKVGVKNYCGDTVYSPFHKTILLNGTTVDENKGQISLKFNKYVGWFKDSIRPQKYEIWRKLGDQDTFQVFATYPTLPYDTGFVYNDVMQDNRNQCFRVKAIYDTLDTSSKHFDSYSNIFCFKFANTPKIYNVFSPNGDGKNEYFYVENVRSYPVNELYILNRWGNKVYHKLNYNNDWDGDGLPAGTYFYIFKVDDQEDQKSYEFKGNVLIVR